VAFLFVAATCQSSLANAAADPGARLQLDHGLAALSSAADDEECIDDGSTVLPAVQSISRPAAQPDMKTASGRTLSSGMSKSIGDSAAPAKTEAPVVLIVAQNTAAPPPKPMQTWDIVPADKTLNGALARWAASAGWQLVWELPVDYAVETRASVSGTFEEAVTLVTKSMENAEIPMKAIFYQGNKVLRIVGKGVE
jgi:hypothetical protein